MKICYITNLFFPYEIGGAEIYVRKLLEYVKKNEEVFVITTDTFNIRSIFRPKVEYINNIKIYRFFPLNICSTYRLGKLPLLIKPIWHLFDLWNVHSYLMVKSILRRERPEVVHSHNLGGLSVSIFKAIKNIAIPVMHTLHDYQLISPWSILYRNNRIIDKFNFIEKCFYKFKQKKTQDIDVITAPSNFVLDYHKNLGFFKKSRTQKIALGIRVDNSGVLPVDGDQMFTVLYMGQLSNHKGVPILINAFKKIKDRNIRLWIAGTGPDYEFYQKSSEGDQRIKFFGFVSGETKEKLFLGASVMALPSVWYDNSPVSIYESFKYNLPVIASKIGGLPELIIEGYNGLLVEPGDIDQLSEKITYLKNNPEVLDGMKSHCRESLGKYDFRKHTQLLLDNYESII